MDKIILYINKLIFIITFPLFVNVIINPTFANGGPVDWKDISPTHSGVIKAKQNQDITLIDENLEIKVIDLNTYKIKATYNLKNNSHQNKKLFFGVPILGEVNKWNMGIEGGMYETFEECMKKEIANDVITADEALHFVNICKTNVEEAKEDFEKYRKEINKKSKEIEKTISIYINNKEKNCTFQEADKSLKHKYNGWCAAEIEFEADKISTLIMEYTAEFDYTDSAFSKSALTVFNDRKLIYDFSPAGYWQGEIKNLNISLDTGIYENEYEIISPQTAPKKFEKLTDDTESGTLLKWNFENIDLKKTKPLEINFSKEIAKYQELIKWNQKEVKNAKAEFEIKASSELKNYPAENIADGDPNTAWCASKESLGLNEWVEFKITKIPEYEYCKIESLILTPGYIKNQKTFDANSKITKVAVQSCDGEKNYDFKIEPNKNHKFAAEILENESYRDKTTGEYNNNFNFIQSEKCFKLKILDINKGTAKDTCISEAALVINCY